VSFVPLRNASAVPLARIRERSFDDFRGAVLSEVEGGRRLASLFADAPAGQDGIRMFAVLADDSEGQLLVARTRLSGDDYPALTPLCPQAHLFEREMAEQLGVRPQGHPWLKPVRFHRSWRAGHDAFGRGPDEIPVPGVTSYFTVEGEEVHEVAVGPVHAGVIEPGHFRFQCHGERVFHLEISLGYQHRGVEEAMKGGPAKLSLPRMETVAGETTAGHAIAYVQALEALSGTTPPARAQALRGVALELERLANHVGGLGALAGDVGYLPTASYCGRIRGDFLNLTAALCGSRFGRGLIRPGGTGFDVEETGIPDLAARLARAVEDARGAVELLWATPTVVARFEKTGAISRAAAEKIGLVGPAARATGLSRDVRQDHPHGIFRYAHVPVMTAHYGDVNSRAVVRWLEMQQSAQFVADQLARLPKTSVLAPLGPVAGESLAVSLVEGWRGEICHVAVTDAAGAFRAYKVIDPSFHNWAGLALALRGQQISDFPLCNKSFNLSYCGVDL
jgi:Ni,Fe-hydrogenase III large subunit